MVVERSWVAWFFWWVTLLVIGIRPNPDSHGHPHLVRLSNLSLPFSFGFCHCVASFGILPRCGLWPLAPCLTCWNLTVLLLVAFSLVPYLLTFDRVIDYGLQPYALPTNIWLCYFLWPSDLCFTCWHLIMLLLMAFDPCHSSIIHPCLVYLHLSALDGKTLSPLCQLCHG